MYSNIIWHVKIDTEPKTRVPKEEKIIKKNYGIHVGTYGICLNIIIAFPYTFHDNRKPLYIHSKVKNIFKVIIT